MPLAPARSALPDFDSLVSGLLVLCQDMEVAWLCAHNDARHGRILTHVTIRHDCVHAQEPSVWPDIDSLSALLVLCQDMEVEKTLWPYEGGFRTRPGMAPLSMGLQIGLDDSVI